MFHGACFMFHVPWGRGHGTSRVSGSTHVRSLKYCSKNSAMQWDVDADVMWMQGYGEGWDTWSFAKCEEEKQATQRHRL